MKRSTLIGWAVGSFSSSVLVNAIGLLHLRFMTDSLGLSIALGGTLAMIARVYDTFLDPVVGMLSDRTRTRFGRYRPYLAVGGLLAALSMVMLFNVPAPLSGLGLAAFVAFSLLFFSTAYTLYRIPYLALGRSLTQDFKERSRLMAASVYGNSCGSLVATTAAPFLLAHIGSDRHGHGVIALILAVFIAVSSLATFALIGQEPSENPAKVAAPHASIKQTWRALRENRPFQCLIGFKVIMFTGLAVHVTSIPYFTRHVLHRSDVSLGSLYLIQTIMMMVSQIIWVPMARRFGRRNGLIAAGILDVCAMMSWSLIPAGHPMPWLQISSALTGAAAGGIFLGLYTVLTDAMDYTRRHNGDSGREGILAGVFVMVEKATAAGGTFVFSMILGWAGYVSAHDTGAIQPASVAASMKLTVSFIPAFLAALACLCLINLRLDKQPAKDKTPDVVLDDLGMPQMGVTSSQ